MHGNSNIKFTNLTCAGPGSKLGIHGERTANNRPRRREYNVRRLSQHGQRQSQKQVTPACSSTMAVRPSVTKRHARSCSSHLIPQYLYLFFLTHCWPSRRAAFHRTPQHTNMAQGKIFQYCVMKGNTMNHMTSWMDTENSVQLIVPTKWEYEHRAATEFETFISYKSPIVRTQSVTVNSAEQSPSWEADQISASQEIHWNFWNLKVQ